MIFIIFFGRFQKDKDSTSRMDFSSFFPLDIGSFDEAIEKYVERRSSQAVCLQEAS